ncbi:hypothetical protein NPIL_21531 [Nephila pilipes]|uniref:Uncharacterized protein n=1 Tax=Nephila pilipes TaxID=299642 RepID=A0A8X6Q469_NEPPI|nr:hypothetical protein NPIL_21531 [Nephila pilipes]
MATEMECNNSRPSSPRLTQDKETCETLRLMNKRLRFLKMQHEDAYSHVCHIESRYMDRESNFYKGAYGLYLAAKEAAEKHVKTNRIRENHTFAAAVANDPQQMTLRDSDIPAQTEERRNRDYHYNTDSRSRSTENSHSDNFYQAIELIANLGEIFNKLSGLIKHLPSIKAAKGAEIKNMR